jgi:hypothetical protein
MKKWATWALLLVSSMGAEFPAHAKQTTQIYVPKYFVRLAEITHVPADILYALTVKESSTKMDNNTMSPWPWTINYAGRGYRYASYEDMIIAARHLLASGKTAFDIGVFQVNWKWNGHRAESLEDLGLPQRNGIIAAEIIKEQYKIHRDWIVAAGRYHNPSNRNGVAEKYSREYRRILKNIQSGKYQKSLVAKATTEQTAMVR